MKGLKETTHVFTKSEAGLRKVFREHYVLRKIESQSSQLVSMSYENSS